MEDQQFSREPYTLYVANIPKTVPQSEIEDLFKPMDGYMDINLLKDKDTSQFKGVAFINFQTVENAQDAIRKYNKTIQWGSEIVVDYSDKTKQRNKELMPAYALIQGPEPKEDRMNNITKTLSIVAPIEILIGTLIDKRETKPKIRSKIIEKMGNDAEDIEPLINELADRVIQRRRTSNY